jgi:peroxiredoxin
VQHREAILGRGVDAIAVTSVNDVFVLDAWQKASAAEGIEFLADGNGDFVKATGLDMDGTGFGLGIRSKRYSMLVEDGVVRLLNVEESPSKAEVSGAEAILKVL